MILPRRQRIGPYPAQRVEEGLKPLLVGMPGKGFLPARGGDPLPLCGAGQSVLHFFAEARFPFGGDEVLAVSKELQHVALPVGDDESATGHGLENPRARLMDGESPLRIPIVRGQDDPGGAVDLSPDGRLRVSAFHEARSGESLRSLSHPGPQMAKSRPASPSKKASRTG